MAAAAAAAVEGGRARKRLQEELAALAEEEGEEYTASPDDDTLFSWTATILGPVGTPYSGGMYQVSLRFEPDFPASAPRVTFKTRIFHPHVRWDGVLSLNVLADEWNPDRTVREVLHALVELLKEEGDGSSSALSKSADSDSGALNLEAASLKRQDPEAFFRKAREWNHEHADGPAAGAIKSAAKQS